MQTIGFAGTAKNTGKTTTALEVLSQCSAAGLRCALTSIGFDGENLDHVTGLPKPRYHVPAGTQIATAQKLLAGGSARLSIHAITKIQTILGSVVLAEVDEPGTVVLAGPNRQVDLTAILELFQKTGAEVTLVDGALNRLVPLIGADSLVLSTGAAFDANIATVASHAGALAAMWTAQKFPIDLPALQSIQIWFQDGTTAELPGGSLISEAAQTALLRHLHQPVYRLVIPFACHPRLLMRILDRLAGAQLVLGDALKCIASGSPQDWQPVWQACGALKIAPSYLHTLPLRLMTVNPFYPHYFPGEFRYEPSYVDSAELVAAVRQAVPVVPVMDIRQPPQPNLLDTLHIPHKEEQ